MNKFQSKINRRTKRCITPHKIISIYDYPELFTFKSYYKARKFFRKFYKKLEQI